MQEDQEIFVGGVCIHEDKVLLIHRINKERLFNQEYFVFPGKTLTHESIEEGVVSLFESYGIRVKLGEEIYRNEDDVLEYYYTCVYEFGEIQEQTITDIEKEVGEQYYVPLWISLQELDDLIVYPESLKEILQSKTI